MHKLLTVLLESGHRIETILIVLRDEGGGAWHNHRGEGFVAAGEVFDVRIGDSDQVGFQVVRVLDDELRGDDGDK